MKTRLVFVILLFAVGTTLWAAEKSLDQLKASVATASAKDLPKIYVSIAQLELKNATAAFDGGDSATGQRSIGEVALSCENAAESAIKAHKRLKETEIALRKISERVDTMRKSVSFEDREPLAQAIDRIQAKRADLLNTMFSK